MTWINYFLRHTSEWPMARVIRAETALANVVICKRIIQSPINNMSIPFIRYLSKAVIGLPLLWSVHAQSALDRVGDFALLDSNGSFHQLSRYKHRKLVVLMSYISACYQSASQLDNLLNVRSRINTEDVEFLLIDSEDLGRAQLREFDPGLPLLEDDGQLVSESLGISNAGDVIVLNPQRLSLIHRGPLAPGFGELLTSALAGSIVDTSSVPSQGGCEIAYPVRDNHTQSPPDYSSEVAPIIVEHCSECHRQGGVGPFAMDSYIMLLGWSPMIREVLLNKRMPPAQVDPYIGHSQAARYLSKEKLQTLVHWIDNGAPRGEGAVDPLEQLPDSEAGQWLLGEPDFIVAAPANQVPRTGVMDYIHADVSLPFAEDRWIRALQYRPGDASVLHHLMTYVTAPEEDFWGEERAQQSVTRKFIEGYAPGKPRAIEFPAGTGVFVPQGHKLSMQFHYVTNGQSTVDVTEMGLYFSNEPGLREKLTQAVGARFVIPANAPEFPVEAEHVFDEAIVLIGVRARMNSRGKKMQFAVNYPDGSTEQIFSVPAYNYGWQPHYLLDHPLRLPAGSVVKVSGAFDNSISNPGNPDPDKQVPFGLESWDEMFTGYFSFYRE